MARTKGGIGIGSSLEVTSSVPLLANGEFPTLPDLLAADQLRHPSWPIRVIETGERYYIKPMSACFLANGTTPVSVSQWGTLLAHYTPVGGGSSLPAQSGATVGKVLKSDGTTASWQEDQVGEANGQSYDDTALSTRVGQSESAITDLQESLPIVADAAVSAQQTADTAATAAAAALAKSNQALNKAVAVEEGANYFLFSTARIAYEESAWRKPGRVGSVWNDPIAAANGTYTVARDGYTLVKSGSDVIAAFELLTNTTQVVLGRIYRYTLGTSRLWLAKQDQVAGSISFPTEADAIAGGGVNWEEQSPASTITSPTGDLEVRLAATEAAALAKLPTPAFAGNLVINAGNAMSAVVGTIILSGNITSLTATLKDGALIEILVSAGASNRTVTVPGSYVAVTDGSLYEMPVVAGRTRRIFISRVGNVYYYLFV